MAETMVVKVTSVTQTPTITAGAYSANDAVGGLLTFADVTPVGTAGPNGAILGSVIISDLGKQNAILDLVLFKATFTATTDNAAFDPSDTDILNCIGYVQVSSYASFNDSSLGTLRNINLPIPATADGKIYGQLVTRTAPTYTATSDLQITLEVIKG